MKAHELRQLSDVELMKRIQEEEQGLANLRFQKVLGQLEKPSSIGVSRKEIARMKTLLRERETSTNAKTKQI
ncbi:MAG: 50S ribosomal protein L29 [Ignavibacteria bacterium GWA2_55_11]|uniref:Large ribosomal subunit protein uL29 n=1 Tax=uncultured Ignavibacteria bacterium Rifle_16ft_4_minimus_16666 TaxID=1665099 RepID=A0A0H4T4L4_9BACT|nr:50S ribosomal protein L29, large subunit ribosomal protein L29 [uncultured Ignavibacteria bacterium Rifle_16ft_4_minimus_16666]OGU32678.1 MAG: 50S ribosomal protein L29 [Ignavibacteria bacterium GWA2_55_11]OGU43495.1 MAG: 50S ribosomal protein L29 [Ignavibacteria bacterium GWC2_56_12]OGU65009.1 MAG: 50S ribosomal protein L29 [Ignavibacteria bacterium RIFCSPHIGHO2_02_FULL_56_12]OGU71910.1 MAG: 50S ribosomal protein L29 [Ignavibacteria bacterium RIFCSPLOWO2_12_FULL_56_21]OGU74678.1 MAG: 50S r